MSTTGLCSNFRIEIGCFQSLVDIADQLVVPIIAIIAVIKKQCIAKLMSESKNSIQRWSHKRNIEIRKGRAMPELVEPTRNLREQSHQRAGVHVGEVAEITQPRWQAHGY